MSDRSKVPLRELLVGTPWGEVWPARAAPPPPAFDARTAALRVLRRFLVEIVFLRPDGRHPDGKPKPPIEFRIPDKSIHIGWPDYEVEMRGPTVVFLHQQGNYRPVGLTPYLFESSRDKYGPGTVLYWSSDYEENVALEIWAEQRAELRGILAGIENALNPTELMYGVRFRIPDYFDQIVTFTPGMRQEFDEEDSARHRRRARLELEMSVGVVSLVRYTPLEVDACVEVGDTPDFDIEGG